MIVDKKNKKILSFVMIIIEIQILVKHWWMHLNNISKYLLLINNLDTNRFFEWSIFIKQIVSICGDIEIQTIFCIG